MAKRTPKIVVFKGKSDPTQLLNGKEYEVIAVEDGWYRVIDEEGYDPDEDVQGYLYPPGAFDVIAYE